MVVISDTSVLNYLVLIGAQELLPRLFGHVIVPGAVWRELQVMAAPAPVKHWAINQPRWVEIKQPAAAPDKSLAHLDEGEREAILLAEELGAELLLVDESAARREAVKRNLAVSGTLGILDRAAEKGLANFVDLYQRLRQTSFYVSPSVERFFLERDAQRKAIKPSTGK